MSVVAAWWKRQPGHYACLATKARGWPWRDHFFKRDEIDIADFIAEHEDENCYFCVHLLTHPRRIKANAVRPQGLWADLDAVDPSELGELRPTIAILSSPGRYAGLWDTDRPVEEALNKRLTYHVGADKGGWALTKVLRLPDSLNYKYTPPARAVALWDDGPTYRIADLERLPQLPQPPKTKSVPPPIPTDALAYSTDILKRYPTIRNTEIRVLVYGQPRCEDRSRFLWKAACILHEHGVSDEEAFTLLWNSAWNKYFDRGEDEVWRLMHKVAVYKGSPWREYDDG
jgi:hypothetical protein